MSVAIPSFLSHLPTDRRGLPVPYVNRWGRDEDVSKMAMRYDRLAGHQAVFYDDEPGVGEPNFTSQNFQRQRECTVEGRCQVCRRQVPWSRRFLVVADMSVDWITFQGEKLPTITEPWLDDQCATFAMEKCPALIRRRRDENLILVPVTSKLQARLIMSQAWIEGPLEAESKRVKPVMWAKILLTETSILARRAA